MPGPAQGGVHQHRARGGQGRREQGRDPADEHRHVLWPSHGALPCVPSPYPEVMCGPCALSPSAVLHLLALPAGTGEVMPAGNGGWRPARDRYRIPGNTSSEAPANVSSCVAR